MGTSLRGDGWVLERKDHPHAYGDKLYVLSYLYRALGSSPRVWGQVVICLYIPPFNRIIPTRMGTSLSAKISRDFDEDHPHAYGDKLRLKSRVRKVIGSSPRVWGQEQLQHAVCKW